MEISADMMATMAVSVGYDGKDIKDVTAFTDKVVIPYLKDRTVWQVSRRQEI